MSPVRGLLGHPLLWIVALGTALRAHHLDWALPGYNFPDDVMHFLRPAARIAAGAGWLPDGFVHPPVLVYLLAAVFRVWGAVTGEAIAPPAMSMTAQLAELTLVGRATNVALAAATIAMTHAVARRLAGRTAGLVAAAAVAFAPVHVLESHRLAPDVAAMPAMLAAVWLALVADERRSAALLLASAVAAGLAGATRYTAAVPVAAAPLWVLARRGRGPRLALLAGVGVAAAAGFALGCIPCFLRWDRFVYALRMLGTAGYTVAIPGAALTEGFAQQRWVYPLLVGLPFMTGWAFHLLALGGLATAWTWNRRAGGLVLALVVPYVILIGAGRTAVPRYWLPLLPFLATAAGLAVAGLAAGGRRRAAAAVAAVACGYTALLAASQVARLDLGPQRRVGELVAALAARARPEPLVVAYPSRVWLHYDAVARFVRRPDVRLVEFPPPYGNPFLDEAAAPEARAWLDQHGVDAVVLPSWVENGVLRARPDGLAGRFYAALEDGRLGFRPAGNFRSHYLTEPLYTWGDVMLNTHWETAIAGYRVFVRDEPDGG